MATDVTNRVIDGSSGGGLVRLVGRLNSGNTGAAERLLLEQRPTRRDEANVSRSPTTHDPGLATQTTDRRGKAAGR